VPGIRPGGRADAVRLQLAYVAGAAVCHPDISAVKRDRLANSDPQSTSLVQINLAEVYATRGKYAQVKALLGQTLEIQRGVS
jgi:hypothetical protein